jgi:beta-galactosidase/beta-glucuronidase
VREKWLSLNGPWQFAFDDEDRGEREGCFARPSLDRRIIAPFPYQSPLSGIGETGFHDVIWYSRGFELPEAWRGKRILLNFGAVDYETKVWVNGEPAGENRGGHVPFSFDITELLRGGENAVALRVCDTRRKDQPRGKQDWELVPSGIKYMRTSGIWQTVFLEPVGEARISDFWTETRPGGKVVRLVCSVSPPDAGLALEAEVSFGGERIAAVTLSARGESQEAEVEIESPRPWSPEEPSLYDVALRLKRGGETVDEVRSYFGLRTIEIEEGRFLLNGERLYLRFALDQGYFPEGHYVAPGDDWLRADVEWAKRLGFNGVRKHQKVEDPRWLYWCDRLGLLVWGEMANAWEWSEFACEGLREEWARAVRRDRGHPSIITWVPFNETWGIPKVNDDPGQQGFVEEIYDLTKSLDPTRAVCDNSGWHHVKSDIVDIHDYEPADKVRARWSGYKRGEAPPGVWPAMARGSAYAGQPIVISEYGGLCVKGYEPPAGRRHPYESHFPKDQVYKSVEDFLKWYGEQTGTIQSLPEVQGFCFTELYDIEQEVNGLLTYDRRPKVPVEAIREINLRRRE